MFVNKRISFVYIVLFTSSILLLSCRNKEESLHKKIHDTIEDYVAKDLAPNTRIDSIKILRIDSLSEYQFIDYVLKPVIENEIEELSFQYNHLSENGSMDELILKQQTEQQINILVDKLLYYDKKLSLSTKDSGTLSYYFVSTLIYTKTDTTSSQEYYGFPITPDFQIREIKELIAE